MATANNPEYVQKITAALGLERVRSLSLHFEVNAMPVVDVEFFPDKENLDGVAEAIGSRTFRLVEITET
jgi:hypothetical protein